MKVNYTVGKVIKHNYRQILLVFFFFLIMVLVSCFHVGAIVSDQMHDFSEQVMNTTETEVSNRLEATGLLFSDVVRSGEKLIRESKTNEEFLSYLEDVQAYYIKDGSPLPEFMKIYGYIQGDFLDGSGWIPPNSYDATQRPWYLGAEENDGNLFFSEPYPDADSGEMCISFSKMLFDENHQTYGILAIDLNLSQITDYVRKQTITKKGYGILVSNSFTFAAHGNEELVGEKMSDVGSGYQMLSEKLENGEPISAVRFKDYDGTPSVAFFRVLFNGWYIGIITTQTSYIAPVITLAISISSVGFILAIALSTMLVRTRFQKMKSDEENLSKSTFLARMSHEMRTPMNAIIGMTEIALKSQDTERVNSCLEKIDDASKHLLGVINDVLDMSKIEAGKLQILQTDFVFMDMIEQVKNIVNFKIDEKHQTFKISISENVPQTIVSDDQRLSQVITNLISNASKFTPEFGEIDFIVDSLINKNGEVIIKFLVIDNGIGISPDQQEKLFKSFEQADGSISRKYGGTGLGLAISKKIIEMLGGTVWIESELGKGSTFGFIIPTKEGKTITKGEAIVENTADDQNNSLKGKVILLAEDIEINQEIVIALLDGLDLIIETANNGVEAFEMVKENPQKYDLILMDMQMPEMDGLESTKKIRSLDDAWAKQIPIIAMTANVFKEDIDKCINAGMDDHTGKPIDIEEVLSKIKLHLSKHFK